MRTSEYYMSIALKEAKKAFKRDEVPIGCIIVCNDKIIAKAHNMREHAKSTLAHAEMLAITKANAKKRSWRLQNCNLYVTVEPCLMCAGAIVQSKINKVYFGVYDPKGGALGSSINVLDAQNLNWRPEVHGGICLEECSQIMKDYFKTKRITHDDH